ncbi:MAG: polymer-forming cytoskeletal protein [Candidatus Marinimicrobia bacterium]|nr:polymer-forming cytoskeletal protein [Candidatus Neomarinimicrobiota bacterium]
MKEKPTYTIIGDNTEIQGTVKVKGSIMIAGHISGDVEAEEIVRVALGAQIDGRITAGEVVMNGFVKNGIQATGKVILGEKSDLRGDLIATRLIVEEGAVFSGTGSVMDKNERQKDEEG